MSTCSWVSFAYGDSIVNIGMEAIGMLSDEVICFIDLKTKLKSYYKPDNPAMGYGVQRLVGHYRFPMFAFSETVMRPSIHVMRYPDMGKLYVFKCDDIISYIDLAFSDHDHLIALSGYPNYIIRIWSCRTGNFLVEVNTNWKCSPCSLMCSGKNVPLILQYSKWHHDLTFYELQFSSERTNLHEISKVVLNKDHSLSIQFSMCFSDEGVLYIINDYGMVFSVDIAQFRLKRQWATHFEHYMTPRPYYLYHHKQGLMVANSDTVVFIKKLRGLWAVEWVLPGPHHGIVAMVTNFNGEVYTSDNVGNLFQLNVYLHEASLVPLHKTNFLVTDCGVVRGIKEENLLILTTNGDLRAVDIIRCNTYSMVHVDYSSCLALHSSSPYVVVGTLKGNVHFMMYDKIRAPVLLKVLTVESNVEIVSIRLADRFALAQTAGSSFHGILADFRQEEFLVAASTDTHPDTTVLSFFLIDEQFLVTFVARNSTELVPCADEMWLSEWLHTQRSVRREERKLPKNYRCITMMQVVNRDAVEFIAVPLNSFMIDIIMVRNREEVICMASLETSHYGYMMGISGTRNIVTWSMCTMCIHFRSHKRSPRPFVISRFLHVTYEPRVNKHVEECFNGKYLVILTEAGALTVFRLPSLSDNVKENVEVPMEAQVLEMQKVTVYRVLQARSFTARIITPAERQTRELIAERVKDLEAEVRDLIDYDISVTGKTKGIYRKFCLNYTWLDTLNQQAQILCDIERKSLMDSVADQERIRTWILRMVTDFTKIISVKVRAIFTNTFFECYSVRKEIDRFHKLFDIYRFYDMDPSEEDFTEPVEDENDENDENSPEEPKVAPKKRKRHLVIGDSIYDHVMAEEFQVQDKNNVTGNQMSNENVRFKIVYNDPLKNEFNKKFVEVQKFKQEIMENIASTNAVLKKIYDNMNIMLHLLHMETFVPAPLSVPVLTNDEVLERIMTVDDSEIKAINRRRKKTVVSDEKRGRLLLWSLDFWVRALNTMMDGVLEKLWEEEIKKTPPEPEFVSKKHPHDYTLEEQKLLRLYEETLRLLTEDRRKYLRILNENELKTIEQKNRYILKFNEKCAEMAILKLKFDYAIRHLRVRLLTTKITHYRRIQWRIRLAELKEHTQQVTDYISRYTKLIDFWERSITDLKVKLENLTLRSQTLDRQFKGQFLATIPAHLTHEASKLFRRRPKMLQRSFNSSLVCFEVASRITQKQTRAPFPLANEVKEYFNSLEALDDLKSSPGQLDTKHWDALIKLRRQKIETELKIKGCGYQLNSAQNSLNSFILDLSNLKNNKLDLTAEMDKTTEKYFEAVQNQKLQVTLSMGQVEISLGGDLSSLRSCILMNLDDVNAVNDLIKKAGAKKLRTMMRLAVFRRQVIYKEWEHQVVRANIEYLKYMLQVIEKCKVTMEFLDILRNWKKVKEARKTFVGAGVIERAVEQKIAAFRKNLERIIEKIDVVKEQIITMKHKNQVINHQIDDIKVSVAMATANRDVMMEERREREQNERMNKIKQHSHLIDTVRRDYAHILELKTILELQRLRTYPTLGPLPDDCPEVK